MFGCKVDLSKALETEPSPMDTAESSVVPPSSTSPDDAPVSSTLPSTITQSEAPEVTETKEDKGLFHTILSQ